MSTFEYKAEYEQSVLGCLLQDYGAWQEVQPLRPEHFFASHHKAIFQAIGEVVASGKQPDPILVSGRLGSILSECGGLPYLDALAQCVPNARNAAHYAKLVRDEAINRLLLARANEIAGIVAQNIPVEEKVSSIWRMFMDIAKGSVKSMPRHIADIAVARTQYYEDVQSGKVTPG